MKTILNNINDNLININTQCAKLNEINELLQDLPSSPSTSSKKYKIMLAINYDYDDLVDTGLTVNLTNTTTKSIKTRSTEGGELDKYGYYKLNDDETNAIKNIKIPETYLINGETLAEGETEYRFKYFDPYSVNKLDDSTNDEIIIKTLSIQDYTADNLNTITNLTERWTINKLSMTDNVDDEEEYMLIEEMCGGYGLTDIKLNDFPDFEDVKEYNFIKFVPSGSELNGTIWQPSRKYWPVLHESQTNKIVSYISLSNMVITEFDPLDDYVQTSSLTNKINERLITRNNYTLTSVKNIDKIIPIDELTDFVFMFSQCFALTNVDLSDWNVSKITHILDMFYACKALTNVNLSNWDTSDLINSCAVFYFCDNVTTINLSNWNVSKVTNMDAMFYDCYNLTTLYLNNWVFNDSVSMGKIFNNCSALTTVYINTPNDTLADNLPNSSLWTYVENYDENGSAYVENYSSK